MKRRWSSTARVLLCMSAALAASLTAVPAAGAGAGRAGTAPAAIVFVRGQGHPYNGEIWTMGRHGGNQVRLTRSEAADYEPEWSPDGTRIAWTICERRFRPERRVDHEPRRVGSASAHEPPG
jgi:hypothetical protein